MIFLKIHEDLTGRKLAALLLTTTLMLAAPVRVSATSDMASSAAPNTSSAVSSNPDATVSEDIVSSNPQETLGTVGFSDANARQISVGKSTTLYLTVKDMGYGFSTTFTTSDKSIATVEQVDVRAVKVVGLKSGKVTITATVSPKSGKGTRVARYTLTVGESDAADSQTVIDNTGSDIGTVVSGEDNVNNNTDLDLFSSTTDPMLIAYADTRANTNATSLLLGLIAWIFIISAVVYVFSVVIGLRTPKLNVSPGTRKRYSTGGSSPKAGNRLLSDRYYRNMKKY